MKDTAQLFIHFEASSKNKDSFFNSQTKTGYFWGSSPEFYSRCVETINNKQENIDAILKLIRKELTETLEDFTITLKESENYNSTQIASFRIIQTGYNPSGFEVVEWNDKARQYPFTHEDENKLTKSEAMKECKRIIGEYYQKMVERAFIDLPIADAMEKERDRKWKEEQERARQEIAE